jgi:alanyl aminopeptidase
MLAASAAGATADAPPTLKLDDSVRPVRYAAELTVVPGEATFTGAISIDITLAHPASRIWLNGIGLHVKQASLGENGREHRATVEPGNSDFFALRFDAQIPAGAARLHLDYSGEISRRASAGIFEGDDAGNRYLLTQFESTDARRAFPCFDQPDFKTPWRLTLHVRKEDGAFSNTPQVSETPESGGMKKVVFQESKPLPSYLVAFAVGPFDVVNAGTAGRNHVPLRVIAPKGKGYQAKYAAEITGQILDRLENYFGIAYPYEKLDGVAIPLTYGFGAMENAGLITYQQTLILGDPATDTETRRRLYASVAAHEMAHQWFGDLVTLNWWDDTWLNEAFATWTSSKILAEWKPGWNTRLDDLRGKFSAMHDDSLVSARQIRQPITSKDDISNAFDGITYEKGAAVIRMFELWAGEKQFQEGVRGYLHRYAYKNARLGDFLDAISSAAKPELTQAFSSFLLQPGVPLVSVSLDCSAKPALTLSQKRFLPIGSDGDAGKLWETPVCVRYGMPSAMKEECFLLTRRTQTFPLTQASGCPNTLMANARAGGYYLVRYEEGLRKNLLAHAKELSLAEQRSLLNDMSSLADGGEMRESALLEAMPEFASSPERQIVSEVRTIVAASHRFIEPELEPNYASFVRKLFGSRARSLGWSARPGDDSETRLLRAGLVPFAATAGDDRVLAHQARSLAEGWLKNRKGVDSDMVGGVLATAAWFGDRALFDRMVTELNNVRDRQQRHSLILALGRFREPSVAGAALDLVLRPDLDMRETGSLLFTPPVSRRTERMPFEFVKAHYSEILGRAPRGGGSEFGAQLPRTGQNFCDASSLKELTDFFGDKADTFTGGPRIYANVLERAKLCEAKKSNQESDINTFYRSQKP